MESLNDSGEITFKNTTQNVQSCLDKSPTSPNSIGAMQCTNATSQPVNTNELLTSIHTLIQNQFSQFDKAVNAQLNEMNCKIDGQFEEMQNALDQVRNESNQPRVSASHIRQNPNSTPYHCTPPPHLDLEGPNNRPPYPIHNNTFSNRNFSNAGNGDNNRFVNQDTRSGVPHVSGQQKSNAKPRKYDGNDDFGEYLSQFEIIAEINQWDYNTRSLQLAGVLAGQAVGVLGELSPTQRRDYDTLVTALNTRFGSLERGELYRARLKVLKLEKGQNLSQLAQEVKKLTRQAYPHANRNMLDILSLDYYIDALPDPDIRLRIRESRPQNITEAETLAVRLETYRLAENKSALPVNAITSHSLTKADPILSCLKSIEKSLEDNFDKVNKGLNGLKYKMGQSNKGNKFYRNRYGQGNGSNNGSKNDQKADQQNKGQNDRSFSTFFDGRLW